MDLPLSPALARLLAVESGRLDVEVSLSDVASQLAASFGEDRQTAGRLLEAASGSTRAEELLLMIGSVLPFDSTVRDLATTGHLGKLLCRGATLRKLNDPRIVGLPNTLFDVRSWTERSEYFQKGVCHTFDPDLFRSADVIEMLRREAEIANK